MEHAVVVEFWFELASTYSYLAAARIEDAARTAGVSVVWKPFLLGPIFQRQGWSDSPFNLYPAKGAYMWRDLERSCARYGLPFRRPAVFPRNSVRAARVAMLAADEGWVAPLARAVFHANFVEDRDIGDGEVLAAIVTSLGKPGPEVCARAESPAWKPRLREQTEEAMKVGIFGAPTFVVRGELFWGDDRLDQAIAWAASPA